MIPLLFVPALIQEAPALPPVFPLPEGLRIKPDSYKALAFDQESFEIKPVGIQPPRRLPVRGRTWRFLLESSGIRASILSLQQILKPALLAKGWVWQWEQRGVARLDGEAQEFWVKVSPSGAAALSVVLVQPGQPRTLTLVRPGKTPEIPAPDQDFPYLAPWPGGVLMSTASSKSPVIADLGDGRQGFVMVHWIEKEYALEDPPSPQEFVTSYRRALEAAGWEIEGGSQGGVVQVQAIYLVEGRDIRLNLRLAGNAMAVSVADVGAQRPR